MSVAKKSDRNSIASCFPALREKKHGIKPNSNFYYLLEWNAPICDLNCFFQWMQAIAAHMGVGTPCARETLLVQLRTCFHAGLRGARAHCGYLCRQSDKRQTVDLGFLEIQTVASFQPYSTIHSCTAHIEKCRTSV